MVQKNNQKQKEFPTKSTYRKSYRTGEHALTQAQVEALLNTIDNTMDLALFKVAISCGIRRDDMVKLKWKDVDIENSKIDFYEQKKRRVKRVYFDESTKQSLKLLQNSYHDEHYLFPGDVDKKYGKGHISDRTAYNKYQEWLVRAGVQQESDRKPFHSLRSTCVKLCQRRGWSVEQTAKHIGDSVRVVQEHYSTPTDEEMKELVQNKPLLP